MGEELFGKKFLPVKEKVSLFCQPSMEELALAQILYPYCNIPIEILLEKVSGFGEKERQEVFEAATNERQNRTNPTRPV